MSESSSQVLSLEEARARAIADGDAETLAAMTHEDYVHVDAQGRRRTKREFLDDLSSAGIRSCGYSLLENGVRVLDDVAIVTGSFLNHQVGAEGTVARRHGRHVRIYLRGPAGWSNVLHQATEIADPWGAAPPGPDRE